MKEQILKMLRESDGYISGQSICNNLNVSRTAVWKCINQLKESGYEFDAVSNKGYRIVKYPDLVSSEEIESLLMEGSVISSVEYLDEVDSTNNWAKKEAEAGAADGTFYITECQTGGRGRRGRTWISPKGSGIWMTLLLRPSIKPFDASMLTLVAAMATAKAIEKSVSEHNGEAECRIKWPNDIVLNSKKICGMLTEMSAEPDAVNYVVIGIGINVNTTEFDESIKDTASSIIRETGIKVKRSEIVADFAEYFTEMYNEFLKTCNLSELMDTYNEMLINKGRQVRIIEKDNEYTAVAEGIDETGALIIDTGDGKKERIVSGEVSVRGLYGYV